MCNVPDKNHLAKLFGVATNEIHDLKEWLLVVFKDEIKPLGINPDIGWCESPNKKQLCFSSKIKSKSVCLKTFIEDYVANTN